MAEISTFALPDVLLILGTDLSGKNHVANLLADIARDRGCRVEKRQGAFAAQPTRLLTSEEKGAMRLLAEWAYLATLPLHRFLIPFMVNLLVRMDLRAFQRPPDSVLIVISHTALRLLALYLGCTFQDEAAIRLPAFLDRTLREITPCTGARAIVLDIDHAVRRQRMAGRAARGKADPFDRYMEKDDVRSERIEAFLVWLGIYYFGAVRLENNDSSDLDLLERFQQALASSRFFFSA